MTSPNSSAASTVTPQSSEVHARSERTVTLDTPRPGTPGLDTPRVGAPAASRGHEANDSKASPARARRGSPDPLHATDRYRLTVPFVDRIR